MSRIIGLRLVCLSALLAKPVVLNAFGSYTINSAALKKFKSSKGNSTPIFSSKSLADETVTQSTILLPTIDEGLVENVAQLDQNKRIESDVTVLDQPNTLSRVSNNGGLDLWKRRLITHEDPFSLHKLSAIGYTVSSAILLGSAAIRYIQSPEELFSVIPPEMESVMNIFTASNIIMCVASVRMAFTHRQGDLTARNAFLGTAVSSLFSGFYMVWISPFVEGDIFNSLWISRSFFAILVGLNSYFIADSILATEEIVEGRRDRKATDYKGRKIVDTLGYVFPVAWGMPLIVATGYIACILHDRAWFMDQCQFIDQQLGYSGMRSHIFYQQLSTSLAASYASLFVTLRDKKLISKTQELGGITVFALPALIWSIYTTVIFTSYLFVPH